MPEIIAINENTWRIEDEYVRFFVLCGTKMAVVIDSGVSGTDIRELVKQCTDLPAILVNTHGDGDHTSGTGFFSAIYMDEKDYISCNMQEKYPNTALQKVVDQEQLDLGGRTLEIVEAPGHTKGSIAILDVENRMLYAGDSVQSGQIFMFGKHREPKVYVATLEKLIGMNHRYDTIVASHAEPLLPGDYAEKVLEDWKQVQAGTIPYTNIQLHGMDVKSYAATNCGFYCE